MVCLGCVIGPSLGSFFGSSFVLPKDKLGKAVSIVTSIALTVFTVQMAKKATGIAFCELSNWKFGLLILGCSVVGLIYSLAVNYLLNKVRGDVTVSKSAQPANQSQSQCNTKSSCCCNKNKKAEASN